MARPRVILATNDAEAAVQMIAALNPKRYRVEHIFDLSEALLRAKIVLAHALVIHSDELDEAMMRELTGMSKRVTPVFVSAQDRMREEAAKLTARFVPAPFDVPTFKRAVYRAVSKTQERRHRARKPRPESELRSVQRLLLLHRNQVQANVMAAVLKDQLGASCEVATTPHSALVVLDDAVDCVVAEPALLMSTNAGVEVARELARRGIPVIPLARSGELDVASAGQAAWDIAPQVRRSLTARSNIPEAG